jgi:hypothetical protein
MEIGFEVVWDVQVFPNFARQVVRRSGTKLAQDFVLSRTHGFLKGRLVHAMDKLYVGGGVRGRNRDRKRFVRRKISPLQIARIKTRPYDFYQHLSVAFEQDIHVVHVQEGVSLFMERNNSVKREEKIDYLTN